MKYLSLMTVLFVMTTAAVHADDSTEMGKCTVKPAFGSGTPLSIRWSRAGRAYTHKVKGRSNLAQCRQTATNSANFMLGILDEGTDFFYQIQSAKMTFKSDDGHVVIVETFNRTEQ